MIWITNHPKPLMSMWPRRAGCEYIEGPPKATFKYTVEEFESVGTIGVYVDMEESLYRKLPLMKNPKEMKEWQKTNQQPSQ